MITNFEKIAEVAHNVNRAFCKATGDDSQPTWDNAPDWQKDSAINGVKFHLENPNVTPEESHINWMNQKISEGWIYGKIKDPVKKEHPCILPYNQLPLTQQIKDHLFREICHSLLPKNS